MQKFKVIASYVSYCVAEIEAENEAEAYELAREMDGGDFIPVQDSDDWTIESVEPIEKNN